MWGDLIIFLWVVYSLKLQFLKRGFIFKRGLIIQRIIRYLVWVTFLAVLFSESFIANCLFEGRGRSLERKLAEGEALVCIYVCDYKLFVVVGSLFCKKLLKWTVISTVSPSSFPCPHPLPHTQKHSHSNAVVLPCVDYLIYFLCSYTICKLRLQKLHYSISRKCPSGYSDMNLNWAL